MTNFIISRYPRLDLLIKEKITQRTPKIIAILSTSLWFFTRTQEIAKTWKVGDCPVARSRLGGKLP